MTKTKKEKIRDMTSIKEKIKYIANIRLIFESKQILSLDRIKTSKGITLIALVITIIVLIILARSKHINANRREWNINASRKSKGRNR